MSVPTAAPEAAPPIGGLPSVPQLGALGGTPPAPLLPIRGLAIAVISLLGVWVVVTLGLMAVNIHRIWLISRLFDADAAVDIDGLDTNDTLHVAATILQFMALVATAVVFIVWMFRARDNAEATVPAPHRLGRPWLVLGWGVPVVNLWFPKRIMDDIWRASHPSTPAGSRDLDVTARPALGYAWWAAWLTQLLLDRVVSHLLRSDSLDDIRLAAVVDANSAPIGIAAAVLVSLLVWRTSDFQERRRARILGLS
ncbi:DUF4328 domain-containing protein [Streptoalloteichus tenebrarius]|uniref:DUF4328 domain-containing protein n=1 Tax=Streptoalloteichus tenebrarius (strain ATCC 17920 / DSM 40477 / JCM 4838 / CBS 697.72 / NBRC 16177 / NCIMB 11028 / NRRL B-12390 / A12253. 1 / ISP 5477) TaxID=1933 RepID=UPI0020A437B0|nr:DUF4328 domain-containing protein [Streptoalloteichus tenebrarius]